MGAQDGLDGGVLEVDGRVQGSVAVHVLVMQVLASRRKEELHDLYTSEADGSLKNRVGVVVELWRIEAPAGIRSSTT